MMYAIKHLSGKYCRFGSYSKAVLVEHPYQASLYSTEKLAQGRLKPHWIKREKHDEDKFLIVKIKFTYKEV